MQKVTALDVNQFFTSVELELLKEKKRLEDERKEKILQAENESIASIPQDTIIMINTKLLETIPLKGVAIFTEEEFPSKQNFDGIILAYKRKGFYVEFERRARDGDQIGKETGPATLYIHREPPTRSCRGFM